MAAPGRACSGQSLSWGREWDHQAQHSQLPPDSRYVGCRGQRQGPPHRQGLYGPAQPQPVPQTGLGTHLGAGLRALGACCLLGTVLRASPGQRSALLTSHPSASRLSWGKLPPRELPLPEAGQGALQVPPLRGPQPGRPLCESPLLSSTHSGLQPSRPWWSPGHGGHRSQGAGWERASEEGQLSLPPPPQPRPRRESSPASGRPSPLEYQRGDTAPTHHSRQECQCRGQVSPEVHTLPRGYGKRLVGRWVRPGLRAGGCPAGFSRPQGSPPGQPPTKTHTHPSPNRPPRTPVPTPWPPGSPPSGHLQGQPNTRPGLTPPPRELHGPASPQAHSPGRRALRGPG